MEVDVTRKKMWVLLLGWLLLETSAATSGDIFRCDANDMKIFEKDGATFTSRFRSFGGMFVSKSDFEKKVSQATGLSAQCASCYGDSYICGYDNCKWKCAMEGDSCTSCLHAAHCIETCNRCTGFIK
jgi:hypothetical protein